MSRGPKTPKGPTREGRRYVALVRELKEERKLTQDALGELLGIDQTYVSQLLKGTRGDSIGAELIRKARDAVHVDPDYFFDDYEGLRSYHDYPRRDRVASNAAVLARLEQLERAMSELRKDEPDEDPEHGSGVRRASSSPPTKE